MPDVPDAEYWRSYFEPLHQSAGPGLDVSSPAMWHAYAVTALGRTGPLLGRSVLDAGCGSGALVYAARALGSPWSVGFDVVEEGIKALNADRTDALVRFEVGDLADPDTWPDGDYDVITCVEAAHYVDDPLDLVADLWDRVTAGGRLVVTVADGRSGYVAKVRDWHGGRYASVDPAALGYVGDALPGAAWAQIDAISIAADQRMVPVRVGPVAARAAHRLVLTVGRA